VTSKRDRDASVEHLLRRLRQGRTGSPLPDTGAPSCLDAGTLAGWIDGTLTTDERAAAETHVSDCSRCLAVLAAMARTDPSPAAVERRSWGLTLRWLIPLTAAATAVVVWVAVPRNRPPVLESEQVRTEAPTSPRSQEPAAQLPANPIVGGELRARRDEPLNEPKDQSASAPAEERQARTENAAPEQERGAVDNVGRLADATRARPPAAAPAEARPDSTPERTLGLSGAAGGIAKATAMEVVSPDPMIRWRIGAGGSVQLSTNGGSTWEPLSTDVREELLAGASPSPSICWLVGRAGTVWLSTDGRRWQRVAFPDRADLTAVRATDARTASVTTVDGRTYSTIDGGLTWDR